MDIPDWVDRPFSEKLPALRRQGEGQFLEFKAEFPKNGHDLSREIAAFASTNPRTILIGVSDTGELLGVPDLDTATIRDRLRSRVEGLCASQITPAITPVVKFAREGDAIVFIIEVPRGSQPIYYSNGKPYIRHLSSSRPAQPHEVAERFHHASMEVDPKNQFLSDLAESLVSILMLSEQVERRNVKPWISQIQRQAKSIAVQLRDFAARDVAEGMNLVKPLRTIADLLDRAAARRHTLGSESWKTYTGYWVAARDGAKNVMAEQIYPVPLSVHSQEEIHGEVHKTRRALVDLDSRAKDMADDGRLQEVQDEASRIGALLLRRSYDRIDDIVPDPESALRPLTNELDLLETERLFMDGGQSMQRVLSKLHDLTERLRSLISEKTI